jgi:hypothetical protein
VVGAPGGCGFCFWGEKGGTWGGGLNRGWAFGGVVTWWGVEKVGMCLNICWVWVRKTTSD